MSIPDPSRDPKIARMSRRGFFAKLAQGGIIAAVGLGAAAIAAAKSPRDRRDRQRYVWQIDPNKCTQCGLCRTSCVLKESAAKCVQDLAICGYCRICFGYLKPDMASATPEPGVANEMCPANAIVRKFVEPPYYEYTINERACVGCALCVDGCRRFGNGSLYLQIRHDRCLNCNECSIAAACPADAIARRPADDPYIIKSRMPERPEKT